MRIGSKLRRHSTWFEIFLCLLLSFIFWIMFWRTSTREGTSCNLYIEDNIKQSPPRTILLWNKFFGDSRWTLPADTVGPSFFKLNQCPECNCIMTNDMHFLMSIDRFDAILFHVSTLPDIKSIAPRHRRPEQLYVFGMVEGPLQSPVNLEKYRGFFNLTMTYRLDSDISWPYGSIEDIETGGVVAPAVKPQWRRPPEEYGDRELEAVLEEKKKFAVWFVSHCTAPSKREELVKNLQKYVSVDVYGDCGPLKCDRFDGECYHMVDKDYKFFLSFENSLCIDYVTEKLHIPLTRKVIPVVFGGADYSRFAPPHSYIDANDFTSAKALADYLTYLSDNPKEYVRYFWWRKYYRAVFLRNICDICAQLNTPLKKGQLQVYNDIKTWWMNSSCYQHPKISLEE